MSIHSSLRFRFWLVEGVVILTFILIFLGTLVESKGNWILAFLAATVGIVALVFVYNAFMSGNTWPRLTLADVLSSLSSLWP